MKEVIKIFLTILAALTVTALIGAGIAVVILWADTLESKAAQATITVSLVIILVAAGTTAAVCAPLED